VLSLLTMPQDITLANHHHEPPSLQATSQPGSPDPQQAARTQASPYQPCDANMVSVPVCLPRDHVTAENTRGLCVQTYFRDGDLWHWQQLMHYLGYTEHFGSKTQCRKVRTFLTFGPLSNSSRKREMHIEKEEPLLTRYARSTSLQILESVWVNIVDFLDAVTTGQPVRRFKSRKALVKYTQKHHKFFPKRKIPKGSPLRGLMKCM
jgi:hypothetical protein